MAQQQRNTQSPKLQLPPELPTASESSPEPALPRVLFTEQEDQDHGDPQVQQDQPEDVPLPPEGEDEAGLFGLLNLSFSADEISSQSTEAGSRSPQVSDSEEDSDLEMPSAKQNLQREKEIQVQIRGEFSRADKYSKGALAISSNVQSALKRIEAHLIELENLAIPRITAVERLEDQNKALNDWLKIKDKIEMDLAEAYKIYHQMPGVDKAPDQAAIDISLAKSELEQVTVRVRAEIAALKGDFDQNWTDPGTMNRAQYVHYAERIATLKKEIWPGLVKLNKKLCEVDGTKADDHQKAFSTDQAKTSEVFHEMAGIFAAMAIPEESLNASQQAQPLSASVSGLGEPEAQSTQLHKSLLSIIQDSGVNKGYRSYRNEDPPDFLGDPSDYALWKREWQNSVCVGRDDAWIVRSVAEHVKVADDPHLVPTLKCFTTQAQVWQLLDKTFANPTIVCERVLAAFMKIKPHQLQNHTPQSQIVSLNLKVQQLILNLESVKREAQFHSNPLVLTYAIRLLPEEFCTEFCRERQKAERAAKAKGETFEDADLSKIFTDFISDYSLQFREFQPHTLIPPRGQKTSKAQRTNQITWGGVEEIPPEDDSDDKTLQTNSTLVGGSGANKSPDWGTMVQVKRDWKKMGKCPVDKCDQEGHYWTGNKGVFASDQLTDCPVFRRATLEVRMSLYKKLKLCKRCTSRGHQLAACTRSKDKLFCRKKKQDGTECKGDHATLFHGGSFKTNHRHGVTLTEGVESVYPNDVMLAIVAVVINGRTVVALLDNGSNATIITHKLAKKLGLVGFPVIQEVELCGKAPEMQEVTYYNIKLTMPEGDTISIRLIGVDKITSNPGSFDISVAYSIFPHHKRPSLDKPSGEVELLIGADQIRFQPSGGQGKNLVGNLCVYDIPLPPYVVLMGSHPKISFTNPSLTQDASKMRTANMVSSLPKQLPGPICLFHANFPTDFWEAELLGYHTPRKCNRCAACTSCHIVEEGNTVKAQLELQAMDAGISYDSESKKFQVKFPIIGDITAFKDNRKQAEVRAESLKKSLTKRGLLEAYQAQIDDFIERGVWKKTDAKEIRDYVKQGGYIHYVGHHPVLNPSSLSTPVRLVVDTAMRNNYTGPKLSSLYAKGPNCLNSLYSVLTTWRSYLEAGVFDVSKCYHGMKTGEPEFFMRLVVWKMPGDEHYSTWGHCCVGFGDISASTLLELIFKRLSAMGQEIDPHTALQLTILRYVDDGLFGGTKEQIQQMRGNVTWSPEGKPSYDGFIAKILGLASFKPKLICAAGDQDPRVVEKQGSVLGMDWDPTKDIFICKIKVNLSKKLGAGRKLPDLEEKDLPAVQTVIFTRRLALQVASQIWDPLGLLVPYTLRLKILMKELVDHEKAWDEPLSQPFQDKWRKLVTEMIQTKPITFPRSLTVETALGRPELVAFFDGSDQAFGAVLYLRFRTKDPEVFFTRLVTSKGRVTPKGGTTTPRSELSGMVVATRLCSKVIRALSHTERPVRVTVAGDSKCSVTAVDTNCAALNPFFANRALEVIEAQKEWGTKTSSPATQELNLDQLGQLNPDETIVDAVQYLPGPQNPADWPSRANLEWIQLDRGSVWQDGPEFLRKKREHWPFSIDFLPTLPAEERRKRFVDISVLNTLVINNTKGAAHNIVNGVRMLDSVRRIAAKYTDLTRATAVLARVYRASRLFDRAEIQDVENQDLNAAKFLLAFVAQLDYQQEILDKKVCDSLSVSFREGLARARGRMGHRPLKNLIGHQDLILLSNKSDLARLVMWAAHREDHRLGSGDAVFRSVKLGYWILQARRLADKIIKQCMLCRTAKAKTAEQRMGDLPDLITQVPVRPFSHIALDFAGAIKVRSEVNKKSYMKAFPLLMICLNTGSIHVMLCSGYSTEKFLISLQHFFAIRGRSQFIYTDMGTQLTAASNKMDDHEDKEPELGVAPVFNFKKIKAATASHGVEWQHCPVQTQWRDGRSEAAIKSMKRTIRHLNPGDDLTYAELACLLARAANQVNERPLGVRHHQQGSPDICVITPNLLLQGSRTCAAQDHSEEFDKYMSKLTLRLGYIEQCYQDWWNLWLTSVWPSLVPFRRWKTTHRNVRVGDIVLVRHQGKVAKPSYRLARVLNAKPDDHGVVRTVTVGYRPRHVADKKKGRRYVAKPLEELAAPVQRLVVLLAVEEQHQLPPPSQHRHDCPGNLVVPAEELQQGDDRSPPAPQPVPLIPIPEVAQEDREVNHAPKLDINFYRQQRDFNCWQCNHLVFQQEWAEELERERQSRPLPPL